MLAQLFAGGVVNTLGVDSLEILPQAVIGVSDKGTILFVHAGTPEDALLAYPDSYNFDDENEEADIEIIEAGPGQFFFPGFFDTHIHAPQYPNAGIIAEETLLKWLDTYTFPLEATYSDDNRAAEVYERLITKSLGSGTTMASYFGTIHVGASEILAKTALKKGQRAQVGRVCMERLAPDNVIDAPGQGAILDAKHADNLQALDATGDHIRPVITPRFAPSCHFETMEAQAKLARERNLPVQTHLDENVDEIKLVGELFPNCSSYADVYDKAGLLKHDTILAHSVHVSDPELAIIKARGSGIAHCPISNGSLASGIAPVAKYIKEGINVGLGSDVAGGYTVSILENVRHALIQSRLLGERLKDDSVKLSIPTALYLSTLGGAKICNVSDRLGNFVVGKQFDAQLIDVNAAGSPMDVFEWSLPADAEARLKFLVTKWTHTGDDRNTVKVFVDGKLVVDKQV